MLVLHVLGGDAVKKVDQAALIGQCLTLIPDKHEVEANAHKRRNIHGIIHEIHERLFQSARHDSREIHESVAWSEDTKADDLEAWRFIPWRCLVALAVA